MAKSIIQPDKSECFLCAFEGKPSPEYLEKHHFMHGTANRRLAERHGLWGYLCKDHHTRLHDKGENDLFLMQVAQGRFEVLHSHEEWMEIFGKNYLIM